MWLQPTVSPNTHTHTLHVYVREEYFLTSTLHRLNAINYFILILVRTNKAQSNIGNGYSRGNYIYWKFYALEIRYEEVNVDIKSKCINA